MKKVVDKKGVMDKIKLRDIVFKTEPNWTTRLILIFEGDIRGEKVEWRKPVTIKLRPSICPRCTTRISGEYDTVVQLRGFRSEVLENEIQMVMSDLGMIDDLIDIIRHKEGVDVYFSHIGAARKFIKTLLKRYEASWKGPYREIIGTTSSGKNRTRNTFIVRIAAKRR